MGQPRLLVQELSIKVAAVAGGFLGRKGQELHSDSDYKFHRCIADGRGQSGASLARTTLGLNGGSTSRFSSAVQLTVLKNGCERMPSTTPNLRLGSRSNSLKKKEEDLYSDHLCETHRNTLKACVRNHAGQGSRNRACGETYLLYQALGLLGDPPRVVWGVCPDGLEELVFVVALEWRLPDQHLVDQYAERPPVNREGVLLSQQDLKGRFRKLNQMSVTHTRACGGGITVI